MTLSISPLLASKLLETE
ncbi:hypothetical protein SCA6_018534 [Theobroma cacao]